MRHRLLTVGIVVSLLGVNNSIQAQTQAGEPLCAPYPSADSVSLTIQPSQTEPWTPGSNLTIEGEVASLADFPFPDGKILARIEHSQELVAEYTVEGNYSLSAKGKQPFVFHWHIPARAPAGQYQVEFLYLMGQRYTLTSTSTSFQVSDPGPAASIRLSSTATPATFIIEAQGDVPIPTTLRLAWYPVNDSTQTPPVLQSSRTIVVSPDKALPLPLDLDHAPANGQQLVITATPQDSQILPALMKIQPPSGADHPYLTYAGLTGLTANEAIITTCAHSKSPDHPSTVLTKAVAADRQILAETQQVTDQEGQATTTLHLSRAQLNQTITITAQTLEPAGIVTDSHTTTLNPSLWPSASLAAATQKQSLLLPGLIILLLTITASGAWYWRNRRSSMAISIGLAIIATSVMLATPIKKAQAQECFDPVQVQFNFDVIRNSPKGNMEAAVFTGDGTRHPGGQWIELATIDSSINPDVPGFALRREEGSITVYFYGYHANQGEIATGTIVLQNATWTSFADSPLPLGVEKQGNGKASNPLTWPLAQGGYDNEVFYTAGSTETPFNLRAGEKQDIFRLTYSPTPVPCPQPDLTTTDLAVSGQLVGEASLTFAGRVQNTSKATAGNSQTSLRLDINADGTWDMTAPTQAVAPLAASASTPLTFANAWVATAGTHRFEICADSAHQITEADELNNCATRTFIVTAAPKPDLAITNITLTGSQVTEQTLTLAGSVRNIGNARSTTSSTQFKINTTVIGTEPTAALAAATQENESLAWTPTQVGPYTFTLCADATNLVVESDENNNCGLITFTVTAQCSDNLDNDADGATDSGDPGCHADLNPTNPASFNPADNDESNPANQAPVAVAGLRLNSNPATKQITVVQGTAVQLALVATGSNDPNGWSHSYFGVSNGGSCQWNSDLNQGSPTFDQTINNPSSPEGCDLNLGSQTFNQAPGTYTYQVLRIVDARGAASNIDMVSIKIVARPIVDLKVNGSDTPPTINAGQTATLSWTSTNATTCTASGNWSGNKTTNGNETTPGLSDGTYTYTLVCSGEGVQSNPDTVTLIAQTPNQVPVAQAALKINGGNATNLATILRGIPTQITLTAAGSSDPDGWTTPSTGVSTGGKCEWNSDLNQDTPTFEQTITNPISPSACDINLGTLTFNDTPGSYTYQVVRVTDARGATSNIATVQVRVAAPITVDLKVIGPAGPTDGPLTIFAGSTARLIWTSINAVKCTAVGAWSGPKTINGSEETAPLATGSYTYTIFCEGNGPSRPDSVTLTVIDPTPTPAPTPTSSPRFNPGPFQEID